MFENFKKLLQEELNEIENEFSFCTDEFYIKICNSFKEYYDIMHDISSSLKGTIRMISGEKAHCLNENYFDNFTFTKQHSGCVVLEIGKINATKEEVKIINKKLCLIGSKFYKIQEEKYNNCYTFLANNYALGLLLYNPITEVLVFEILNDKDFFQFFLDVVKNIKYESFDLEKSDFTKKFLTEASNELEKTARKEYLLNTRVLDIILRFCVNVSVDIKYYLETNFLRYSKGFPLYSKDKIKEKLKELLLQDITLNEESLYDDAKIIVEFLIGYCTL